MKKILMGLLLTLAVASGTVFGAEYTTPKTSNTPSVTYQGYWSENKFRTNDKKQVITFVTVSDTITGSNCTITKDKECVVKDVNLMYMIQEVQRLTQELADLQRMPVCTDVDTYVSKIRDLMNNIEKTKMIIDTSDTKCDPVSKTINREFAIISNIVKNKGKIVYKEVYRYRLPQTGAN